MHERTSSPEKPTAGSQNDKPWYVTLGSMKSGKTQNRAFLPGGKYADPFPIVFKVPSEELADELLTYQDAIKMIAAVDTGVVDRVRLVFTLPVGDNILDGYIRESRGHGLYPVVYGKECAVFLTHTEAVNATKSVYKAIWKKLPSFKRVIAYMISAGESEKSTNLDMKVLLDAYLYAHDEVQNDRNMRVKIEEHDHALPATPSRPTRAPLLFPSTPDRYARAMPATPVREVTDTWPPAQGPDSDAEDPESIAPLLSEPIFDLPLKKGNGGHDLLYQHVRNLRGIKSTHSWPVLQSTKVPSCGRSLDALLQAFGFDIDARLAIAYACRTETTMEGFVRRMLAGGLPVLEGKFMWMLYSADPPTEEGLWAETHIM